MSRPIRHRLRRTLASASLAVAVVLSGCGENGSPTVGESQSPSLPPNPTSVSTPTLSASTAAPVAKSTPQTQATPVTPPGTASPAPSSDDLFAGAQYAKLAFATPSSGGVKLATRPQGSLQGKVIVIDPGHNSRYRAAIQGRQVDAGFGVRKACNTAGSSAKGFAETEFNWQLATALAAQLRDRGATVWLTRPNNSGYGPCINERAAVGNLAKADLAFSIHADGAPRASVSGFHVISSANMVGGPAAVQKSATYAAAVRDAFRTVMPPANYIGDGSGLDVRKDLGGLNLSEVPAIMLESGNMSNESDLARLRSTQWRRNAATVLANGLERMLG